jgi:hypothetical protein
MNIQDMSEKDILAELARRKKVASIPQPLDAAIVHENLIGLKQAAIQSVADHAEHGGDSEDDKQYMWEAVITAVYGRTIWEWWRSV